MTKFYYHLETESEIVEEKKGKIRIGNNLQIIIKDWSANNKTSLIISKTELNGEKIDNLKDYSLTQVSKKDFTREFKDYISRPTIN